jgi:dienelactone hydrolase
MSPLGETATSSLRLQLVQALARGRPVKCPRYKGACFVGVEGNRVEMWRLDVSGGGMMPFDVYRPLSHGQLSSPGVLLLHSTGSSRKSIGVCDEAMAYAKRGYVAVCPDMVLHGERGNGKFSYFDALIESYREGGTKSRPYVFDMAYECLGLLDFILSGELGGIDARRLGISGVSLGGTVAWLVAAAEPRVACCVPVIGVQSYGWALEHGKWHGRVDSLPNGLFQAARERLGRTKVDADVVRDVWDVLAPGLASGFDANQTLGLVAPRPLLVLNGENDPRCPIEGVRMAVEHARVNYAAMGISQNLALHVEAGVAHENTRHMTTLARSWMDMHVLQI